MTRLLWHSNSPTAPTGYGNQTALFAPLLNEDYEVAISTFYGLEGSPVKWKGIPLLPGLGGNFGAEYMPMHAARWAGGNPRDCLTVCLMDVWVIPPQLTETLNMACWTPVDHDPAPPMVKQFFAEGRAVPIAMSRFGQDALQEFSPLYCPHGVDTKVFKPYDRDTVREITGVPKDAFLVGMVSANKGRPSRKGFAQALKAWANFRAKHENAFMYMHTSLRHEWLQGEDLEKLVEALNIPPQSLLWADQYRLHFDPHPSDQMAQIFSSMDVLMNPTMGGGFEIAQLEAAACGVPTITTDFTAMPESAGPTPWKVKGIDYWTGQGSWNMFADVGELIDALEDCYRMTAKEKRALSKKVRKHALKYDVHKVYEEHMLPSIRKAEKRLKGDSKVLDVTEGLDDTAPVRELKPASEGPTISVVVPWHNHPELAEEFWKALDGEEAHEVIVVDNASERPVADMTLGRGKKDAPHRRFIRLKENVGFCPANNIGLREATGEAVLFLNNDIALGIPGWLEMIRSELKPGVLVGANARQDQHTEVDGQLQPYLDGWCIAGMKEDLEKLGGWDEDYDEPAYYSDNDLCFRAKELGMSFAAVNPPLIHLLNQTAGPGVGEVAEVTRRNYQRFAAKVRAAQEKVPA